MGLRGLCTEIHDMATECEVQQPGKAGEKEKKKKTCQAMTTTKANCLILNHTAQVILLVLIYPLFIIVQR